MRDQLMTVKKEIDLSDRLCSGRPATVTVNKDMIKQAVLLLELRIFTIAKLWEPSVYCNLSASQKVCAKLVHRKLTFNESAEGCCCRIVKGYKTLAHHDKTEIKGRSMEWLLPNTWDKKGVIAKSLCSLTLLSILIPKWAQNLEQDFFEWSHIWVVCFYDMTMQVSQQI